MQYLFLKRQLGEIVLFFKQKRIFKICTVPVVSWVSRAQYIFRFNFLEWQRCDVDTGAKIPLHTLAQTSVNALGFILGLAAITIL